MTGAPTPPARIAPPPRPRHLEVRLHVLDGRTPYGRSRAFHLSDFDLERLIAHAERLEARS